MRKGQRHSPEARLKIAEGIRRAMKPWRLGLRLLPRHISRFAQNGQVVPALRPSLSAAVTDVSSYANDLGGLEVLTEGQTLWLEKLARAKIIINARLERFLVQGDESALDGCAAWLIEESRALQVLGLKRAARDVSLATYLAQHGAQQQSAPPEADGPTLDATSERGEW